MLDGVVAFDVERYSSLPERLRRLAGDLDAAAELLARAGDPAGAGAAAHLEDLAAWVRREQARAAARWEQILAIPGFARFETWEWERGGGSWVFDVDWISRTDDDLHSYEELVALTAFQRTFAPLLDQVEEGDPIDRDDVDAALAAAAAIDHPATAAVLLDLLGATGFRRLHGALAATVGDPDDDGDRRRLEDGMGTLTALLATGTRAVGRHALSDRFLDDLLGPATAGHRPVASDRPGSAVDAAQRAFAALDFSREVAGRMASVTGPRGALVVLERAQVPFAVLSVGMPLVDLLQHGPASSEFVESTITSGLNLAAFLAESAPVSLAFFAGALLVSLLFATADDGGRPPRPVRSPDAPNPGGAHYPLHVDEAGVPAAPNGV